MMLMGLESLREGILTKAREKAKEIIENAELKAKEIISDSLRIYEERVKEARERKYRELRDAYEKKLLEEYTRLNIELLKVKNEMLNEVKIELVNRLRNISNDLRKKSLKNLLKEVLNSELLNVSHGFNVYVVRDDVELIREVLREEGLERFANIKVLDDRYLGGIMVESTNSELLIDNTYATRLEKALSIIVRRLSKQLLKGM